MIAALIARLGLPDWARKLAGAFLLVAFLVGGGLMYRQHVFDAGVEQEKGAQRLRDAKNNQLATAALAVLNARVAAAQANLALARAEVKKLEKENQIEKTTSDDLQRRLAAGEQRMRVLIRTTAANPAGPGQGAAVVGLDPGTRIEADLDGTVAANLEWLRSTRSEGIKRLNGCIAEYDALKGAVDAAQ